MALSTGFDEAKVIAALTGRIGWRNPTLEEYNIVDDTNEASASGRFFNDGSFHASCTIQNVYDTQEDSQISNEEFNTFLTKQKEAIIVSMLPSIFDKTELIESGLLQYRPPMTAAPQAIPNTGKFCGRRIDLANGNFATVIDKAIVLLDSDKTFNLSIYKDLKTDALATIEVAATAYEETAVDVGRVLNYLSTENKGGSYYIGYYQDDLGDAQALDTTPYNNQYRVFKAVSIQAAVDATYGFNRFNYEASFNSLGLNLEMSSYYDYTDAIVKAAKAGVFDEYIGLSMAVAVIEQITNNTRSNATERMAAVNVQRLHEDLQAPEVTQGLPIGAGLKTKRNKELKRLQALFHQKLKPQTVSIC